MASPTQTTLKSILIVGPTGSVGLPLCNELISLKSHFVRLAAFNNTSRPASPSKTAIFDSLQAKGMEIVCGTYNDVAAFRGFDAVLMPLSNFGNYLQPQVIDTAIAAGVRHFYPSEFGADITVGNNWSQRYYRDKVLTREHLMKRADEVEGLGWTYITIGRFTEWATIAYFGIDNAKAEATIYGNENGRQSVISIPDTAAFTVRTLFYPFDATSATSRQRTFRFHGESLNWRELFTMLHRITGREYAVTYRPVSEALEQSRQAEALHDDKLAMNASHRVVQGSEGTLLPEPYDNGKFLDVEVRRVEEVLKEGYTDLEKRAWYGI